ncbi:ABC transporter permease [Rhodobacter capsulatus]|uniref:ABC transporter permease n=1 Tax=Rhodobacter capsulatus TaxID=1061 RepID=UPI004038816C
MVDLWQSLPNGAQDGLTALALLAPAALIGVAALRGYRLGPLLRGLILRQIWTSLIFTALIAVSVALGVGLIAQERGLRRGTAQAAAKFDLVIAAPGSEFTAMLAAVYLQPSDMALIDGPTFAAIADHPEVTLAAPIGFGDSWNGLPTVGTTPQFVAHLAGDLAEGGMFKTATEAVVGARVPLPLGAEFTPEHGLGHDAEEEAHEGYHYRVVGRMALTGTPWDRALLVPVESVWSLHGMGSGHAPDWDGTLGQPFDPQAFPGTPAALVRAKSLAATYALQAEFGTERTMAFFPGTILARLHALMGDIRQGMSVLALLTQALVTAGGAGRADAAGAASGAQAGAAARSGGAAAVHSGADLVLCDDADRPWHGAGAGAGRRGDGGDFRRDHRPDRHSRAGQPWLAGTASGGGFPQLCGGDGTDPGGFHPDPPGPRRSARLTPPAAVSETFS